MNKLTQALLRELTAFLKANMPSIREAYADWPNPNQELKIPCLSVTHKGPRFTARPSYVSSKGPKNETTGLSPITKVMGVYECPLQIDLWCSSKPERHKIYEELFLAFHQNLDNSGISLMLEEYHNEWARFDLGNVDLMNSDEGIQRNEWRVRVDVFCNCRAVVAGNVTLIETIENNLETPEEAIPEVVVEEDDGSESLF